jgi:hypothetical protein
VNQFMLFKYSVRHFCVNTSIARTKEQLDGYLNSIQNEYAGLNVNGSEYTNALLDYQKALDAYRNALKRLS